MSPSDQESEPLNSGESAPQRAMESRPIASFQKFPFFFPLIILLAVVLGTSVYYARKIAIQRSLAAAITDAPLPVMFSLPAFSLTERFGQTVTLDTLKGSVWIADFVFTTCPGPCPMMTRQMANLQSDLADAPGVRLLTITVDPKTDTPQRLQEYAKQFRAVPDKWLFLTGDREAIFDLSTRGFRLAAIVDGEAAAESDHPILHSTRFVLVDRQGQIRGYYDGTSGAEVKKLEADARRLAAGKAD